MTAEHPRATFWAPQRPEDLTRHFPELGADPARTRTVGSPYGMDGQGKIDA
jgi:hypothetical protein